MPIKPLLRVLCIDDEEEMLSLLKYALESAIGCSVSTCADARNALSQALAYKPDLILLDIFMPGMDGVALLALLKNDPQTRDLPVVLITAVNDLAEHAHYIAQGAAGIIIKPFDPIGVTREVSTLWQSMRGNGFAIESERGFFRQLREMRPELAGFIRQCRTGAPDRRDGELLGMRLKKLIEAALPGRQQALMAKAKLLAQSLLEPVSAQAIEQAEELFKATLEALTFSSDFTGEQKTLPFIDRAPPRLVVADDDRIVVEMMRQLFDDHTELYTAPDGLKALGLIEAHDPHLVILDDFMPGMTGLKLVETLHASGRPVPPVLMLTGSDRPGEVMRALKAGVADYIIKPFNPAELRDKVEAQLSALIPS